MNREILPMQWCYTQATNNPAELNFYIVIIY